MKKLLVSLAVVTALCATVVCAHRQSILSEDALLANVEALTEGEIVTQPICAYDLYCWCVYMEPFEVYDGRFVSDTFIRPF